MPPVKFNTSHPQTDVVRAQHKSEYTDAQWRALASVKQTTPALKFGAARNEFVNKVMWPDGSVNDDLDTVRKATRQHDADDVTALETFTSTRQDAILRGTLSRQEQMQLRDLQYWANHSQIDELEDHIAQNRFLFIVDANAVTRIYFQCVTPDNPDIEYVNDAEDPTFAQRQARRDAFEQARIERLSAPQPTGGI